MIFIILDSLKLFGQFPKEIIFDIFSNSKHHISICPSYFYYKLSQIYINLHEFIVIKIGKGDKKRINSKL